MTLMFWYMSQLESNNDHIYAIEWYYHLFGFCNLAKGLVGMEESLDLKVHHKAITQYRRNNDNCQYSCYMSCVTLIPIFQG
jgi:hypothetical protein